MGIGWLPSLILSTLTPWLLVLAVDGGIVSSVDCIESSSSHIITFSTNRQYSWMVDIIYGVRGVGVGGHVVCRQNIMGNVVNFCDHKWIFSVSVVKF